MTLAAGWVDAALAPKGATCAEIDRVAEQWRTAKDAMFCRQWDTAIANFQIVEAFLVRERDATRARIAAKRAAKFARRA